MATVSHHLQHAMRPYSICHHQPPSASPLDGSTTAISSGTGGGLAKTIAVGVGGGGGTAVPTVPYFYPTTNQTTAASKTNKKTWSQRLKLNGITNGSSNNSNKNDKSKSEKSSSSQSASTANHQSMSPSLMPAAHGYADPWLYGTVRGVPAAAVSMYQQHPMFYGQPMNHRMSTEVAVVVCSCPEYLNGTKKEVKKASVCKKCKGSRLPLAAIGGTVRLAPSNNAYMHHTNPAQFYGAMAGGGGGGRLMNANGTLRMQHSTVAVRGNSKARPTILGDDPYDQMRRTRLGAPPPTSSPGNGGSLAGAAKMGRHRAKSSSPTRNRRSAPPAIAAVAPVKQVQNNKLQRRSLIEESSASGDGGDRVTLRSRSMSRLNAINSFPGYLTSEENQLAEDLWVDSHDATDTDSSVSAGTRSILQCYNDLNPYDLVSGATALTDDDDDENHYDLHERTSGTSKQQEVLNLEPTEERLGLHSKKYENILNPLFGKQKQQKNENSPKSVDGGALEKNRMNLQNIKSQQNELGSGRSASSTTSSNAKQQQHHHQKQNQLYGQHFEEMRQPQRHHNHHPLSPTDSKKCLEAPLSTGTSPLRPPRKLGVATGPRPEPPIEDRPTKCEVKSNPVVKSILKKYENVTFPQSTDTPTEAGANDEDRGEVQSQWGNRRRQHGRVDDNLGNANETKNSQLINSSSNGSAEKRIKATHFRRASVSSGEQETGGSSSSSSSSTFYVPCLPRKKVQFCEENETFSDDGHQSDGSSKDGVDEGSDAEQMGGGAECGSDKPEINNCRLVGGGKGNVVDGEKQEGEEKDKSSSSNKIGHNCDINTKKVLNHKSSDEAGCWSHHDETEEGAGDGARGAREMEVDSFVPDRHGKQQRRSELDPTDNVTLDSTFNPSGETSTLGTLLSGRVPIQDESAAGGHIVELRRSIRRSLSDRKQRAKVDQPERNLFLDTMALRNRRRKDTRDVDFHSSGNRPKDPPPPPPTTVTNTRTPERPPRVRKSSFVSISDATTVSSSCPSDDSSSYETFNFLAERQRPAQQRHSFPASTYGSGATNRMVMPVLPTIRRDSPAVHRLEIRNEVDYDVAPKKTSIMISGDDCYSTVNVNDETPLYQSSVVVNDHSSATTAKSSLNNTVTINVGANSDGNRSPSTKGPSTTSIIPIGSGERSNTVAVRNSVSGSPNNNGRTLISLDYINGLPKNDVVVVPARDSSPPPLPPLNGEMKQSPARHHRNDEELNKLLRNPVEAVRLNLIPHVCGKYVDIEKGDKKTAIDILHSPASSASPSGSPKADSVVMRRRPNSVESFDALTKKLQRNSFISKLLEDPTLGHLAEGLDNEIIAKLIESSLVRLKDNLTTTTTSAIGTGGDLDTVARLSVNSDAASMTKLIDVSLSKIQEERQQQIQRHRQTQPDDAMDKDRQSNDLGSISSGNSFTSTNYEMFDFDNNPDSDCYQSCSSELTTEDDSNSARSKFYQMLVDATLSEIEISTSMDDDHHYESIRLNNDPIYEEISEIPPPLPLTLPPINEHHDLDKKHARSMFEGASKYDILSYLVDAKERGVVPEESYAYSFGNASDVIIEEEPGVGEDEEAEGTVSLRIHKRQTSDVESRISDTGSDDTIVSSETTKEKLMMSQRKSSSDIERNDSGVGSETSKSSRNKFLNIPPGSVLDKNSPIHLCEDCDGPVETQVTDAGVMYAPLVCRKCGKKRAERKEIITEVVETEEKYGRDLQIILEEFYQPMLVAGLLTQEQLSAIFLNTEELLENNQALAERMRDALDIASEQGDDDLLTVNVGKLFLDATPMLHAFETYCVGQAAASLLLANLEKEKELLRIFLRVSQMENSVLRRMNLNSFLMVPVQRVTKYPLLLARLHKVTPPQLEGRLLLKQAQEKIELHLNHMNQEAKDIPTKLWRRISSSSPGRRSSCEVDMINIKLRKMAIDVLEWNHDEVRFAMEGKLLVTQPTDNNWRKGRTIKLAPINALLVTHGKPSLNYRADRALNEPLNFPRHTGIREASLLLVREKSGRYTLLRDPLYLDRCVICSEADWADYFEVQEISSKDTFIFKAEDENRTKQWYAQLQYHSQGMGGWRKRRNALANIMINGMMMRS